MGRKPFLKIFPRDKPCPLLGSEVYDLVTKLCSYTLMEGTLQLAKRHYLGTWYLDRTGRTIHMRCTDFSGDGVYISYTRNVIQVAFYDKKLERHNACVLFESVMDLVR